MTYSLVAGFGALLANFGIASYSLFSPMRNAAEAVPVPVDLSLIPEKGFYAVKYGSTGAYLRKGADGDFLVFSGACPHMGCRVKWSEETYRFVCPCHEGFFDSDGKVISGPPTSPLAMLPFTIEDNMIIVGRVAEVFSPES